MTETLLAVSDLRAGYGGKPVLQGVSLSIRRGEIVSVVGRNGVGKSTLMKTLIGLLSAATGSIRFNGQEILRTPAHWRARLGVGYVPQGRDVFPRMTVEENLVVAYRGPGSKKASEFERVYETFPVLRERRRQRAGTMSGGQQQQLALARVLVERPSLILLDEPSEGVQPSIVAEIGQVLKRLSAESGLTIVLVEQNLDLIRQMSQRCYVMDKGKIVEELPPKALEDREIMRKHLSV
jgi:urea ABC transporter ATP-binding protein UrtE